MPSRSAAGVAIGWQRGVLLVLVVLFFIALGYSTVYRTAWNDIERTDFTVYSAAGRAVLENTDIYQAHNARGWFYVYPPTFAVFMPWFAVLSPAWGSGLWYLLSVLSLVSALWMSFRLARASGPDLPGPDAVWTLCELPLFLASPWIVSGILRCQASQFMVWLMIAAVYCWWRGRPVLGGFSLAFAALIKAFPIALLAYFAWRRQWRFLAGCFAGLVLGGLLLPAAVFGWQRNLDYWQEWGRLVAGPAVTVNQMDPGKLYEQLLDAKKLRNQSLESLLLTFDVPADKAKPLLLGIALAMLAWMAGLARKADARAQLWIVSAFLCWDLLIPPISETHYFGLLLLPLMLLTTAALGEANRLPRHAARAALGVFFLATLWTNLDKEVQYYRLLCWATLWVWACLLGLAGRRACRAG